MEIATPCHERWSAMSGDERVRLCHACDKKVYNFNSLTRDEIVELMRASEGRACLRVFRRADGTILTADCPVALAQVRRRLVTGSMSAAALVLGLFSTPVTASELETRLRQTPVVGPALSAIDPQILMPLPASQPIAQQDFTGAAPKPLEQLVVDAGTPDARQEHLKRLVEEEKLRRQRDREFMGVPPKRDRPE